MIVSMTGFGDAVGQQAGAHYAVEIRSLNNRFFKPVIKLPDELAAVEPEIESILRHSLGRGSITFALKMRFETGEGTCQINTAALDSYVDQIRKSKAFASGELDLAALLPLPGVCEQVEIDRDHLASHKPYVLDLTRQAVQRLATMRQNEGRELWNDLQKHLTHIETHLAAIQKRAPQVVDDYHDRLTRRVQELLSRAELKLDESTLVREVAVFAERSDISEELQRLAHHLRQFRTACETEDHAGRKLDFITQELLREANTIASKANDAEVGVHVVEIKGSIDRLKEQVQNVE